MIDLIIKAWKKFKEKNSMKLTDKKAIIQTRIHSGLQNQKMPEAVSNIPFPDIIPA